MSWLTWAKLRPAATLGKPPEHEDLLPLKVGTPAPIAWKILLNDKPLGFAEQTIARLPDGQARVTSRIRIEGLRLDKLVRDSLGGLGMLFARGLGGATDLPPLKLWVLNDVQFDYFGRMQSFDCVVQVDDWGECVRLQGVARNDELLVQAYLLLPDGESPTPQAHEPVYRGKLPLPADRLVVDALAPSSRLSRLRVGQHWTFETYNPLRPAQPLQTMIARVEDRRMLRWNGDDVPTLFLVYERMDDDGLSLDRRLSEVWVATDGTVLKQTGRWGQLTLTFELMNEQEASKLPTNSPSLAQPPQHNPPAPNSRDRERAAS